MRQNPRIGVRTVVAGETGKLTATRDTSLKEKGRYGDGAGLWLNVPSSGGKSWFCRWTPKGGVPREMGLGPFPVVSLSDAKARSAECRKHVAAGRDPKLERDSDTGPTFGDCADAYLAAMNDKWTNEKARWQWNDSLTKRVLAIRNRPVAQVDTSDVLQVLNPIRTEIPETARRVRARTEAVLDHARARGWREDKNPARLERPSGKRPAAHAQARERACPCNALCRNPGIRGKASGVEALAGRTLEFTILTCLRNKEVLQAPWSEIDFENALWIVPDPRMKTKKREHRVPLTDGAIAILKPLHEARINEWTFPGQKPGKPLSLMSMEMLLRRMKVTNA